MKMHLQSAHTQPAIARARPGIRRNMAFWVSAVSLLVLMLVGRYGTMAAAGFVGLWMLYILAWPSCVDPLFRTFLPWVFPLFALSSVVWSNAPDLTLRSGIEWLAMVGIGVLMASTLPVDRLLGSWMVALVPVVIIGGVVGGSQFTETGEVAAIGIFGSKNNFALHVSEMLFVSLAVLANARQPRLFRLMALLGAVVAPLLLWRAKSVGAMAVFLPSLMLMCAIIGLAQLRAQLRAIAVVGSVVLALLTAAVVAPVAMEAKDAVLASVGKSGNLTGRALLWQRAAVLSEQRPLLGVGYAAFWVRENPEAEALWRAEHIASRSGFHFHNFYYESLVELGYTGLTIGVAVLGLTSVAVLAWGVRSPGPGSGFFCGIMLFLWLRSFVELDLIGGFDLNALIGPAAWVYARNFGRANGTFRPRAESAYA